MRTLAKMPGHTRLYRRGATYYHRAAVLVLVSDQAFEPRPTFEERIELVDDMDRATRFDLARGKQDPFFRSEAEEVLGWGGIDLKLDPDSASWARLVRTLQEASVEATNTIFLDISTDFEGQRVKTSSGKRRIPVHRTLVEIGFLEFAAQRSSEREDWLFPELRTDQSGYRSGDFSKFFSRYLSKIGIKTDKTSFHSFRHNFEDACRNSRVPSNVMNALQGHSEAGMAARYGDGRYSLDILSEAVDAIDYPAVDVGKIIRFQRL